MIVADTNIVSEFMKAGPDPVVLAWAEALDAADLTICVVTVEEIERGLGRLPAGRRRELEERWHALVGAFAETVAVYDLAAAQATARILVDAEADGRPMTLADAQIAGICAARGWTLATRNVRDFERVASLAVVNPVQ
ncbi:MAG: type II toxin-antitoxin system VapC family toxin [Actinobacteria bacterium]|nr:type II toxin-antitoxin system VapC family toxin [Actinomycetota bacterium]